MMTIQGMTKDEFKLDRLLFLRSEVKEQLATLNRQIADLENKLSKEKKS